MRSLTMISTWACVWQISTHMKDSFSPNVWSFIATEQGSTTVPSFFLSLPHSCCLLITFPIISIYSGTDCRAWCHPTRAKSSLALPTLKRLTEEEKLAKAWQWAEPEIIFDNMSRAKILNFEIICFLFFPSLSILCALSNKYLLYLPEN